MYDGEDDWKEKLMYLGSGHLHYRIVSRRDTHGRIVASTYYDSSGVPIGTDSYSCDGFGRLLRITMEQAGEWVFEYDAEDDLKRKVGYLSGASALGERFEFQHDRRRLLLRMTHVHYDVTVFGYSLGKTQELASSDSLI